MRNVNIILCIEDESLAHAYKLLIETEPQYSVVHTTTSAHELINAIPAYFPDIVFILDDHHSDGTIESIQRIKAKYKHVRIGVLTAEDSERIFCLLKAGAHTLIDRWRFHKDVYQAIEALCKNESLASPSILKHIFNSYHISMDSPLSKRETEVMQRFAEGFNYTDIAKELSLSPETVRSHAKNIYSKLRVSTKTEAINRSRSLRYIL